MKDYSEIVKNKKLFIFDYDDTLVQTIKCKWKVFKEVGKLFDTEITDDTLRKYYGIPFKELFASLYGEENIESAIQKFVEITPEFPILPFEGALDLFNSLLNKNLKVAIISSSAHDLIVFDLKRLGFPVDDLFLLQASDDTEFNKPDPRVFDEIINKATEENIDISEMIYFGDSLKDFTAANAAGMDFIGLEQGLITGNDFKSLNANYIMKIGELNKYFKS
jgi:phosphoglycolate phosphatase